MLLVCDFVVKQDGSYASPHLIFPYMPLVQMRVPCEAWLSLRSSARVET